MSQISRREAALAAAGALLEPLPGFATARSTFGGVVLGVQSYSFRDRPLDEAIVAMEKIGFGSCEMSGSHLEPKLRGAELRQWRLTVPLDHFESAGKKNQGPNVPFGEGDTPIDPVLRYIRGNARKIPCYIEYEYDGRDSVAEVRKCFDFCRRLLVS